MSTKSRRQMLEEMLAAEPEDEFLRYGLALEFAREGATAEAVRRLRALVADRPNYLPAYFQAAQLSLQSGDTKAASELLHAGIGVAQSQSNLHAAEEMSALLGQLES